jgi:hypothetical protein
LVPAIAKIGRNANELEVYGRLFVDLVGLNSNLDENWKITFDFMRGNKTDIVNWPARHRHAAEQLATCPNTNMALRAFVEVFVSFTKGWKPKLLQEPLRES